MSKVSKFYNKLLTEIDNIETVEAKLTIGDSINNHRTLTVNQVIRYLRESGVRGGKKLANNLEITYNVLRPLIVVARNNNRSDGIDINEFKTFYYDFIVNGDSGLKREYGSVLSI